MRSGMVAAALLLGACAANGSGSGAPVHHRLEPGATYSVEVRNESLCSVDVAFGEWRAFDLPPGGFLGTVAPHVTQSFTVTPDRRGYVFIRPNAAAGQRCGDETYLPVRVRVTRPTPRH